MMAHWTLCVPHVAFPSFASDAWISVHFSGVGKQLARPACPPDRQSSEVRMSAGTAQQKHTRSGCNFISFCPAPPPEARHTSRAIVEEDAGEHTLWLKLLAEQRRSFAWCAELRSWPPAKLPKLRRSVALDAGTRDARLIKPSAARRREP